MKYVLIHAVQLVISAQRLAHSQGRMLVAAGVRASSSHRKRAALPPRSAPLHGIGSLVDIGEGRGDGWRGGG